MLKSYLATASVLGFLALLAANSTADSRRQSVVQPNPPQAGVGNDTLHLVSQSPFRQGLAAEGVGTRPASEFTNVSGLRFAANVQENLQDSFVDFSFSPSDFANPDLPTLDEVVTKINQAIQEGGIADHLVASAQASEIGAVLKISTVATGAHVVLKIHDGTDSAMKELGLDNHGISGAELAGRSTTLLNDLPDNFVNYVPGDTISISGTSPLGTPISANFVYGNGGGQNGRTLGALMVFLDAQIPGATVLLDGVGNMKVLSTEPGSNSLALTISDNPASVGRTNWAAHAFVPLP